MHALTVVLFFLVQIDATRPHTTPPTTSATATTGGEDRAISAMERTAAAAERTAAAAEKLAQSAEKMHGMSGATAVDAPVPATDPSAWTGTASAGLIWLTGNAE